MNDVLISLIQKQEGPKGITQFRPIALCNMVIKVITKVIANRLKSLITKLVKENQSSVIQGRQALDNMVILQEVIHSVKKKKGRKGRVVIKVDLETIYHDRIRRKFLKTILETLGFLEIWWS